MIEERGYNRRVNINPATQLPGVSAESFGAGVGAAIERAGQVIQQERLEDARIDRGLRDNAEWSAFLLEDAKAREELTAQAREGRNSDEPGHAARVAEALEKRSESLLQTITSPRLKQQAQVRLAEWGGNLRVREADYEFLRGQEKTVENFVEQRGVVIGRVRRAATPLDYGNELKLQLDAIDTLDVSDEIKGKLRNETEQDLAVSYLRGLTDRDPAQARTLIDSGAFDGTIGPDAVEVLRNGTEVELRRLDAQRAREQSEALASLREKVQTFEQAERMGLIEDDAAFDQAIAGAQALGDESLVLKLTGLKANTQFTRVWGPENATALQRENRLAELNRTANRTPQQNLELEFLRTNAPGWASAEREDPTGQAALRGGQGAPPPIDMQDPGSIAARGQWAAARGVPALTKAEAFELGQLYDSGRQGEEQVMGVLAGLPPAVAMRTARQIEPNDLTLPVVVTLPPGLRNQARRGREALRANRRLLSDQIKDDPDLEEAVTTLNSEYEASLRNVPPDQRKAIFEAAKQLAAGQLDKFGGQLTPELWSASLKFALGGRMTPEGWRGGFDRWGDTAFLLPAGMTKEEFKRAAVGFAQGTSNPPVNPDGSPANLYRAYPVAVGSGLYEFHTKGGGVIRTKKGDPFRVPIGGRQ